VQQILRNNALTNYLYDSGISMPLLSQLLCMHMNYQRHQSPVPPYSTLSLGSNNHAVCETFHLANVSEKGIIKHFKDCIHIEVLYSFLLALIALF
jgi:hypothetical protein